MASTAQIPADPEERKSESAAESRHSSGAQHLEPLPGVMDFIGAHVGGELAEELWR